MQNNYCKEIKKYIKNKNPNFFRISSTLDKNFMKLTKSSKRFDCTVLFHFMLIIDKKVESLFKEGKKKEEFCYSVGNKIPYKEENMQGILLEFNRCNNYEDLKQNIDNAYNLYQNRFYDEEYKENKSIFQVNFNDFSSNFNGKEIETYILYNDKNPGITDELFILMVDTKTLYDNIKDKDISELNKIEKSLLCAMEDKYILSEDELLDIKNDLINQYII